ncbi:quinolinate synthase NadA [Peptoniphilus sp. EMRHCC_23]|uniref:quinolinate synthase NadA n=1 Tax=Peptoniphilus rachelemmaiella TaxID=2811779 RepID=UPI001BFFE521|nr:quinolinate synthase NadA [Peptoniphilus rachelemmaiella]
MEKDTLARLKKEKDAVILAHYYVDGAVQAIADHVGDSFTLAKIATGIDAKTIVMAGVEFMGETVKILNPEKTVYLPEPDADCPMAHMVDVDAIKEMREKYDDLAVVSYVNSTAEVKAHSDYCLTSSNAAKVVGAIDAKHIFFIPDGNLGQNTEGAFPDKHFINNAGCCPVHDSLTADMVRALKKQYPDAPVFCHPECKPEVLELADYTGSTKGILSAVGDLNKDKNIILTEEGIGWELNRLYPDKEFIFPDLICTGMKMVTIDKIIHVLETGDNEVLLDADLIEKAKVPLDRMLAIASK